MINIDPKKISTRELHKYLVSSIGPRPIALASTIDNSGNNNLSPFSFFNIFSSNPPIAIFSPSRRVRNNTTKDTLENIKENKEVVINIVTKKLVEQASLSSIEYPSNVDEFIKAGLTPISSDIITPKRVKESPIHLECKVNDIISLGQNGGAGNLIICKIVLIHINENILSETGEVDPNKVQLVGRLGQNWYCDAFDNSLFEINKPPTTIGVGFDRIPVGIKNSSILNKNDLAKLASIDKIPSLEEIKLFIKNEKMENFIKLNETQENINNRHIKAREYINSNNIEKAWKILLLYKINIK
tara:strand:- start:397 stop:1296 length:900 start_codon:yes stop_codon:yes gene_type:complete